MSDLDTTKEALRKAILGLRASPSFSDFVKTLSRRHDAIVASWERHDGTQDAAFRGEARAYSWILNALNNPES